MHQPCNHIRSKYIEEGEVFFPAEVPDQEVKKDRHRTKQEGRLHKLCILKDGPSFFFVCCC